MNPLLYRDVLTGHLMQSGSLRPDGTRRRDRRVREDNTEEIELYKPPHLRPRRGSGDSSSSSSLSSSSTSSSLAAASSAIICRLCGLTYPSFSAVPALCAGCGAARSIMFDRGNAEGVAGEAEGVQGVGEGVGGGTAFAKMVRARLASNAGGDQGKGLPYSKV